MYVDSNLRIWKQQQLKIMPGPKIYDNDAQENTIST